MLKLKRDVTLFGATAYILGVIVGAGIYVIIGKAAGIAGNSVWLSFLIAGFIAACTGLSYAELASSYPYDSAEYLYTERAFRDRRFAFGIGWLKIITHIVASSAVALGFGGYLSHLTGWNIVFCALLLLGILTIVNLIGVKQAVLFDIIMVVVAVIGLLVVIGFGIPHIKSFDFYLSSPSGFGGILTGAALIFFAFLGFENVGNISEEVKNPKRTLPLALILSVIISAVLYILVAVIAVSVIPWSELGQSASPLSDIMASIMGTKAGVFMAIMALAATGSTVLGLFIGTSRMIYGLAEERSLPGFFLKLSRKRRVPYWSIIAFAVICALFILPGNITSIVFITDFGALFIFMAVNLCLIVLRFTQPPVIGAFRVPVNIGRFPIIPAIGLVTCAALLFSFSKKVFFIGILIFLAGILLYTMFGERRARAHVEKRASEILYERAARKKTESRVKRNRPKAKKKFRQAQRQKKGSRKKPKRVMKKSSKKK